MGYRDLRFLTKDEVAEVRQKAYDFGKTLGREYVGLIDLETHGMPLMTGISQGFSDGVAEEYDRIKG